MKPMQRKPTTPGEILNEEFLKPMGLTQKELANHIGCDIKVINRIINARSSVSVEIALKLSSTFRTTPDFWLNAQRELDLYNVSRKLSSLPNPLTARKLHGAKLG